MSFCTKCGVKLQEGNAFCTKCGASVTGETEGANASGVDVMVTEVSPAATSGVNEQRTVAMGAYSAGGTQQMPVQATETMKPKSKKRLAILVAVLLLVISALVAVVLFVIPSVNAGDEQKSSTPAVVADEEAKSTSDASSNKDSSGSSNMTSNQNANMDSGSSPNASSSQSTSAASAATKPFWGIWDGAYKDKKKADAEAAKIKKDSGYDAVVFLTTDWSNLNSESWYVISVGVYGTESDAKSALASIKKTYPNAYVKYSGDKK